LNLSQKQQVKMLNAFRIKGICWLSPMPFFNGIEEDMETNYSSMPTNCNIDSSPMHSSTQVSVCGSKIEVDGCTPSLKFQKKLDDSI
jgi:hypothetical protein